MMKTALKELRPAAVMLIAFTAITGVAYPLLVTGIGKVAFPAQAEGSLVESDGKVVGSALVAQPFASPRCFWPRPSACGYNAAASSGSNLAMSNPALVDAVKERIAALRASDPGNAAPIPVDLVLASGSGLDPHISVDGARWQAPRIARERGIALPQVEAMIATAAEPPAFGILGEARVNVLLLNQSLDAAR
ncbi:MAG: potassium-transporting ATPase subunit KdpC [Candidatus Sumerlaeia bacterium]|nr:potassium-transporting ATPase subunit KdpC [Candidatus Sumerlaeia bacterium]